jgi:hypothetical protein
VIPYAQLDKSPYLTVEAIDVHAQASGHVDRHALHIFIVWFFFQRCLNR